MSPTRPTRVSLPAQNDRILRSHTKAMTPTPQTSKAAPKRRRRRAGADPWTTRRKVVKNPNPRPVQPPPTHYTCRICAEEQPVNSFVTWIPPSRNLRGYTNTLDIPRPCIAHLSRNPRTKNDPVCKSCIGAAMASKLELTGARTLSTGCLEPGCSTYWEWSYIMKYLPSTSLEAFNHGMLAVWRENQNVLECISESCHAVGLVDSMAPGYPQVECPDCKVRMCASCKIPWHEGISCADYMARHIAEKMTDPEKETLSLMQTKDGKRCPNCYIVIEKDGGCDSMYCGGCKTYFNWAMAASAVPGAKPAVLQQNLYRNTPVVCEMDGLKMGAGQAVTAAA